jgi:predicted transcriptional regulator of viral defense system
MVISKEVKKIVNRKREGEVITYEDFSRLENLNSVVLALSRLYKSGVLEKLGKGLFYKPKTTRFGKLKPSENEILKALLKKNKQGYITGVSAQNSLGLTTQIPNQVVISGKLEKHERVIGNLTIKYKKTDISYANKNIEQLQVIDALKNIKKIPDSEINKVLNSIRKRLKGYSDTQIKEIFTIAKSSQPRVRALVGAMLEILGYKDYSDSLLRLLNPLTSYSLNIEVSTLPNKAKWKIK